MWGSRKAGGPILSKFTHGWNELIKFFNEIIIENGGDIFIKTTEPE